jgi:small GTP-binding protein
VKHIKIIDTSGKRKFINVTRSFLQVTSEYLLVFDLSKQDSFKEINEWFHELKRNQEAKIILVENKKDQKRNIKEKAAIIFTSQRKIKYFETDSIYKA